MLCFSCLYQLKTVREVRKACAEMDPDSNTAKKMQIDIFSAMCTANKQDQAAHSMMEKVTEEDVCPFKLAKPSYIKHISFEPLD